MTDPLVATVVMLVGVPVAYLAMLAVVLVTVALVVLGVMAAIVSVMVLIRSRRDVPEDTHPSTEWQVVEVTHKSGLDSMLYQHQDRLTTMNDRR